MIRLPEKFVETMRSELGAERAEALCRALDEEPTVAYRLNAAKPCRSILGGEPIGWSRCGRYLSQRPQFTLDAALHAGAYYVQEASSQFIDYILRDEPLAGARVLDMCAAPGGKTTIYSTLVGGEGLVVANEINRNRAMILADNVRRWGLGNVVATCNESRHVAAFEEWFDVVAVDAPCSGEGMFRKMEEARSEWNEGAAAACAERQRQIVAEAWRALRRGGILIYSTCTFNRTEDEGVVEWIVERWGDELEPTAELRCPPEWGIDTSNVGAFQTFHFYPDRARGEGFFVAVARKRGDAARRRATVKARRSVFAAVDNRSTAELARWVRCAEQMTFRGVGDTIYGYRTAVFDDVKSLSESLSVVYSGVAMGQIFKDALRPDHALALYVGLDLDAVQWAEVSRDEALAYLRRTDIAAAGFGQGINAVVCDGLPIGFVKRIGARCNNMYPKDLRIIKN